MLYLLDANVLIDAHHKSYPIDRIPEFWDWLVNCGRQQQVKIPREIYQEILPGNLRTGEKDLLYDWLKENKAIICLDEAVDRKLLQKVIEQYAPDLSDEELETLGRDPFLIVYALCDTKQRVVVTNEISKPRKQRANRHIPDVCRDLNIRHCNTWKLIKELDFRTS